MTDETNEPQGSEDQTTPAPEEKAAHEHGFKESLRDGVAKVAGYTVEVASVLAQQGGDAVQAEKEAAELGTEEFIDKVDGEG